MIQQKQVKYFALSLGIASLGTQIVFLRQFLTVFYGNELFVGLLLAGWLLWVGIGSYWGQVRRAKKMASGSRFLLLLSLVFVWSFFSFILIKAVRVLLAIPFGEYIPMLMAALFALFVLAFPCILYGSLFALLASASKDESSEVAATIYSYEAFAAFGIGLLTTLCFRLLSNLSILFIVFAVALVFVWLATKQKWLLPFIAATVLIPFTPFLKHFETALLGCYWSSTAAETKLQDWTFTPYGEISLVRWQGDRILYQNGVKLAVVGDSVNIQRLAASILCSKPDPQRVLVIEGNLSGLAAECARFGKEVRGISIDKKAFTFMNDHLSRGQSAFVRAKNLNMVFDDARRYLQKSREKWDVIALDAGKPFSAAANRFYTQSFFHLVQSHLSQGGVFVVCNFPSGENYLGPELLRLNKILVNTLQKEFDSITAQPGDEAMFFAAVDSSSLSTDPEEQGLRYDKFAISQRYFSPLMFKYLFAPERVQRFAHLLAADAEKRINSDFRPISYLYDMLIWHKMVRGENSFYRLLANGQGVLLSIIVLLLLGALIVAFLKPGAFGVKAVRIHIVAGIIGFAAMAFEVVLIIIFQTLFGYIYSWIGVTIAFFMAGAASASSIVNRFLSRLRVHRMALIVLLVMPAISLLIVPGASMIGRMHSELLFLAVVILCGGLVGAAFPLLCRLHFLCTKRTSLGGIYAADVLGGAVGALLISGIFGPLYGFWATLLMTAGICFFGLLLMLK